MVLALQIALAQLPALWAEVTGVGAGTTTPFSCFALGTLKISPTRSQMGRVVSVPHFSPWRPQIGPQAATRRATGARCGVAGKFIFFSLTLCLNLDILGQNCETFSGTKIRTKTVQTSLVHRRRRVDRVGVCGSDICVPIGPFEADEPLTIALTEGYHDAIFPKRINIFSDLTGEQIGRKSLRIGRVDDF